MQQFEDPAGGEIFREQGQLGEGEGEQVMQLVDEPGALADDGLQASGDLTEDALLVGEGRRGGGLLGDRESSRGAGFDGIGLLAAEEGGSVVLVTLRIAAREGQVQCSRRDRRVVPVALLVPAKLVEEVDQIVGVLPGGIESNVKAARRMAASDPFESIAKLRITFGGFGEREFVGSRLEVLAQEGGVVTVA